MSYLRQLKIISRSQKNNTFRQVLALFRVSIPFSGVLNWIPGLELGRRAFYSIRRNGIKAVIQKITVFHLRRYLCKVKLFIVCGFDLYSPFDTNDTKWPDKNHFFPLNPVSSSCRQGKPSICLVTCNMSSGGAERQVAGLACALKKLGYDVRVRVLRLDGELGHYLPYLKANGVDISVPKMPSLSSIKFMKQQGVDISLMKYLPEEIRIETIALTAELLHRPVDIVHCYLDICCCYGGFAALLSRIPMIRFSWRNANLIFPQKNGHLS